MKFHVFHGMIIHLVLSGFYLFPFLNAAAETGAGLKLQQTIPLRGVNGRIDHFALDEAGGRLFVCALGNNSVEIIDLQRGVRIHSLTGLGSPQGVAYIPGWDRLLVANDKGGICRIYDGKSFQLLNELSLEDDADNVRYDAGEKRIYVGFGNGGLAVLDPSSGKQVGTIKLSAHPEAFELEKNGPRVFVNVPDSRHVAVVDRTKGQVVTTWKTDLVVANFPMALDEANHRLFIGCRLPSKLVVLNTESGKVASKIDISGDPDDLFYDARLHRIYAICGAGSVDVIEQINSDKFKSLGKIPTADGARTGMFSPDRNCLYIAVPHRGSQQAEIRIYKAE